MKRAIDLIETQDLGVAADQVARFQGFKSEAVQLACALCGVTLTEIAERRHERGLVGRRWRVFWLLRRRGWSFPNIGQACGGFDHTSVMYGVRHVEAAFNASESLMPVEDMAA